MSDSHHHSTIKKVPGIDGYPGQPDPQFGKATPGKIAMWIFLVTDAISFSGLLMAYGIMRATKEWVVPSQYLGINLSGFATFVLICSSVSMVMSIDGCARRDRSAMLKWLFFTILGGVIFLSIQAYEYTHLVHSGITLSNFIHGNNLFGSTFFIITGFHGCHVFSGVVYLSCIFYQAYKGKYDNGDINQLEIAGLFWHFVDLVWILVFTLIYLI